MGPIKYQEFVHANVATLYVLENLGMSSRGSSRISNHCGDEIDTKRSNSWQDYDGPGELPPRNGPAIHDYF
jgi:hypothetical protein